MSELISRRSMLTLSAAGALAVALPSCSGPHPGAQPSAEQNDDPQDLDSYGYDPDADEAGTPETPKRLDNLPGAASVRTEWLPPVGNQRSIGNCFVWSAVYGLATFHAARKSQTPPTTPDLQAAPDYAYIRYEMATKTAANTCNGGPITKILDWLRSNGGTPSLAAAPNHSQGSAQQQCGANWSEYQSRTIPPDPRFLIPKYKVMKITGTDGLNNVRTVIAHGLPISFGTKLYTDFNSHYRGHPSPYVGNGKLQKTGHAMLIVGYDDAHSAVKIQNSWGNRWGEKGFVWMSYDTLQKLASPKAIYVE